MILDALRGKLTSPLAAPVLMEVESSACDTGPGGYSVDGTVLEPGTLRKTSRSLEKVCLNPLWAAADGRGLYCLPENGQIVVVNFLNFDAAFPFVSGIWGREYTPAEQAEADSLVVTDGSGGKIKIKGGKITLISAAFSLKTFLEELIDEVAALQTMGPPPQHTVSPASITKLESIKAKLAQFAEE